VELRLRARPAARAALNHPALTGLDPAALDALAAALDLPFRARREQRRHARSGRPRQRAEGATGGGSNRKLDLPGHVIATRLRAHLNLPGHVTAALLGADKTTISHATTLTTALLAALPASRPPPAPPPPAIRPRTLDDLREYAARHGITIPAPPATATTPHDTLTDPATPQTHLILERLPDHRDAPSWSGSRPPAPGAPGRDLVSREHRPSPREPFPAL
jgi:hypothetical protein